MTQQTTGRNAPPFSSALLLADREPNAAIDRAALRALGINRLRVASSGQEVARHLAAKVSRVLLDETEVIICLPQLKDMSAIQFAALVRTHPLLAQVPLLAIASDPALEAALRKSGYNGVLLRPFNSTTLNNTLHAVAVSAKAKHAELLDYLAETPGVPSHAAFDEMLKHFVPPDKNNMSPEAAYKHGVQLMREYQWEEALPFLERAAADALMQADASMALAAFWTVSQEPHKVEICLLDALQSYLEKQDWGKAKQVSDRLGDDFPDSPNPVLPELERRARQNQHETVLHLVELAQNLASEQEIAARMLKGATASLTPNLTVATLVDVLQDNDFTNLAHIVAQQGGVEDKPKQSRWARFTGKKKKKQETQAQEEAAAPTRPGNPVELAPEAPPSVKGIPLAPEVSEKRDPAAPRQTSRQGEPDYAELARKGQVIAPLGQSREESFEPSPLGDIWTMVRGTLRLNRSPKDKK